MPKHLFFSPFLLILGFLSIQLTTFAQEEKPFGQIPGLIKSEAFILDAVDTIIVFQNGQELFPQVNNAPFYYDKRALKDIEDAIEKDDIVRLERLLVNYIDQFGPENFRRDIQLLWKAAQVKQALRDTTQARFYYELFIKHTIGRSKEGRLAYDSLVSLTKSDWLPLEDYYELLDVRKRIDPLTPPKNVLTSMGDNLNSSEPDYAPFMQPDRNILIFTSRREGNDLIDPFAQRNEELYFSYIDEATEEWVVAEKLPEIINSKFNEGSACLAPDGITLFFTRCGVKIPQKEDRFRNTQTQTTGLPKKMHKSQSKKLPRGVSKNLYKNQPTAYKDRSKKRLKELVEQVTLTDCMQNYGDCDIYQATYHPETDTWSDVCNLGPQINSSTWDSQPSISPDGNILFFSSNRQGGFGGTDIYYTVKDTSTQKWGVARNLGPIINTPQQEVTPYFHRINNTLYFSSTGQLHNFGGYDIFKARWTGNSWEEPNNIGPLVNTVGNEYYFTIDSEGETIFYAKSNAEIKAHISQNFDLYSFPMPMESRAAAITKLQGRLRDSITGYPLVGTVMIIDMDDHTEIMPKAINEEGYFEFYLENKKRYRLVVMGDNYLTINKDFKMDNDTSFQIFTQSIDLSKPIVFESLEFKSNSDKLKRNIQSKLDYLTRFLDAFPMYDLIVEGHTDSDGNDEYNEQLSQRRADKIAAYIAIAGSFPKERITSIGYGETRPIVPNDSDEHKHKNRRVEFKLILDQTYNGPNILPSKKDLLFDDSLDEDEDEFEDEFLMEDEDSAKSLEELKSEAEEAEMEAIEETMEKEKSAEKKKKKNN